MPKLVYITTSQGNFDPDAVLDHRYFDEDSGTTSLRKYLKRLLWKLILEEEGFDSKRPFGNSGWVYFGVLQNLAIQGVIASKLSITRSSEGNMEVEVENMDTQEGIKVISTLIDHIFYVEE